MPTKIAAQPSKYQCDGNDEHDAGGNHQNLEGVIARNVIVGTLYALHGHDRTPCQQTPIYFLASYLRGNAGRRIPHRVFWADVQQLNNYCCASERPITKVATRWVLRTANLL